MIREAPRPVDIVLEELGDLRSLLEAVPSSLRDSPIYGPYEGRLAVLEEELHYASLLELPSAEPIIDLRLQRATTNATAIPARFLGAFLSQWQSFFDALGQAAAERPTRWGVIPSEILAQTRLEVHAFPAASFGVRMSLAQSQGGGQTGEGLGVRAYRIFEELVGASADQDRLAPLVHKYKARVSSHYDKLLHQLASEGVSLTTALRPGPGHQLRITHLALNQTSRIRHAITQISSAEEEEIRTQARLNAANLRTGAFELDLGDEGVLAGKLADVAIGMLNGATIGALYTATILARIETHAMTGDQTTSYTLLALDPL